MIQLQVVQRARVPWTERVYNALPVGPVWAGAALAAGLILAFLASEYALGRHELLDSGGDLFYGLRDLRVAMVLCLITAYLPTAYVYVLRGAIRSLSLLRPVLARTDAGFDALAADVGSYPRWSSLGASLLGTGFFVLLPLSIEPGAELAYDVSRWSPELVWHRVLAPVIGWWLGRIIYAVIAESSRLSRASRHLTAIDLLDLRALAPFTRQGLANAFWVVGLFSISALLLLEVGFLALVAQAGTLTLAVAMVSLVLPVRGVHRRIRAEKEAELDRVRAAIRGDRSGLVESRIASQAEALSLADLVAYEARIEKVREWPFDASTLIRFALYLMIPLGSWSGGALVERLIDGLLE
jgi:hypothetical protein